RHRGVLLRRPRGAAVRARCVARRSACDPAAPVAERLAADLHLLHDLRSAHLAGLAAWPLHLRGIGRRAGALHGVLHADATRALRRPDRTFTVHPADRQASPRGTVFLDPPSPARSIPMKALKSSVAVAAVLA